MKFGGAGYNHGKGGYSVGYKKFKKGDIIYVCCGGRGGYVYASNADTTYTAIGGYNGGSITKLGGNVVPHGYGGCGATHMALVTGTLASIGKTTFDEKGLIVAGGGSGAKYWSSWEMYGGYAGSGGGLTSSRGTATQTSGYAFGQGGGDLIGSGGGYYGGNRYDGGSGWIGGVPDFKTYTSETTQAINDGNGKAIITFITS